MKIRITKEHNTYRGPSFRVGDIYETNDITARVSVNEEDSYLNCEYFEIVHEPTVSKEGLAQAMSSLRDLIGQDISKIELK